MVRDGFMQRARELAEHGRYTAAPNPLVGAVVVRDDEVVGEGWHARAGGPHAEVVALESSGVAARGAALYVTLEPCNHQGKTPPCTDAILRAGIERVVAGHLDPNQKMRGRSIALLREAGVGVEVLGDDAFERQNEQFAHFMRTGRPFVHVKLATTLDGKIAARGSERITGEQARMRVHELRAEAGAVLVGAGTARADDPLLTARDLPEDPPPIVRTVLDPNLTLRPDCQLVQTAHSDPVVVFAANSGDESKAKGLRERGVEVVRAPVTGPEGELDLGFVLEELGGRGVRGVLVEGGGETAGRFVGAKLADKLTLFYAPRALGVGGVPLMGSLCSPDIETAPRFCVESVERFGEDVALTLYPAKPEREEDRVHRAG